MLCSLQLVVNSSLKCCKFVKDKCLHCCVPLVWPSAWLLLSRYKPTVGLTTTKWLHLLGISLQIKNVPSVVLVQAYLSLLERVWPLDWLGFNRVCVLSQYKPSKYVVVYTLPHSFKGGQTQEGIQGNRFNGYLRWFSVPCRYVNIIASSILKTKLVATLSIGCHNLAARLWYSGVVTTVSQPYKNYDTSAIISCCSKHCVWL